MTTLDLPRSNLRTRVDANERVILIRVQVCGDDGKFFERGEEPRAYQFLVEDGYLTHTVETGMSRSYSRFRLTERGKGALCLVEAGR